MKEDTVRSIERAFSILRCFSLDHPRLSLAQIAERIGLPVTTTLRIVTTLVSLDIVKRHEDRSYSLGNQMYLLGAIAKANYRPQQIAYPYMKNLRDETKEAVSLYGIDEEIRVCYEHVPSLLTMRCVVRVGDRFQLWAGASGKVLLAYAPKAVIDREIAKIKPITEGTIVDEEKFRMDLAAIRGQDYAISYGEREEGIISVAVPIFDGRGSAIYALSLAGPSLRFTEERALELIPDLQQISMEIAEQLFI